MPDKTKSFETAPRKTPEVSTSSWTPLAVGSQSGFAPPWSAAGNMTARSFQRGEGNTMFSSPFDLRSQQSFSPMFTGSGEPAPFLAPPDNLSLQAMPPPKPITITLDSTAPWKSIVDADVGLSEISIELYGVDLSSMFEIDDGFMSMAKATGRVRITLFTDLLKPKYADEFHSKMESELDKDVNYVESKLMETWVDDDDESKILGRVRWWSEARAARDRDGVSYFDRFLGRLESEKYYTDYLVTESGRSSFLSLLYEEIEDDAGDLVDLISNNSERFGGYRPTTLFPSVSPSTDRSELLVQSVTAQLLDRMVGFTSGSDEQGIVGMVTALPGALQARVLKELMTRHKERRLKIFSRTGEQDEEGMLYFLFEDLEDEDKRRMGDSLRDKGVLTSDAVETLISGRSWAGRNLPWSTRLGENAAKFWAKEFNESDNMAYSAASATLGSFASLWTPDTAGTTIVVLATANPSGVIGSTVARAPLVVQKGLLVLGTGAGAYQATTATMQAVSGEDASGRQLSGGERVGKAIEAVSLMLMLGAGFATAAKLQPRAPTVASETALAPLSESPLVAPRPATTGGQQRVAWRVMSETPNGDITAVGINHETGEMAVVNINKHTGDGSVFSPKFGRANIVGGKPIAPRLALEAGDATATGISGGADSTLLPTGTQVPKTSGMVGGKTPLGLPGEVAPVKPPSVAPLELGSPPALRMLESPKYEDIGADLQQHLVNTFGDEVTGVTWSVAPDGTAFTLPPASLRNLPIHTPSGILPPGEIFRGQPVKPMLVGPLREGFSPFDIFPSPGARTTLNLSRVRNTRGLGPLRGKPGVDYAGELFGGETEQTLAIPEQITESGLAGVGMRRSDVIAPTLPGKLNLEVKNYLRFINGPARTVNQVSPNATLRGEMWRDAMIPYYYPDQQPVWVFLGAPPSPALAAELAEVGIPWYVHSDAVPYLGGILP